MAKPAYVGVSGFSYPAWRGTFYPTEAKSEDLLAQYSWRLGSVEINSSFYAQPSETTVRNWAGKTSGTFRFSFKAPKLITHILKLGKGASDVVGRFSATLDLLGPRRGPILFQLPPFSKQDLILLRTFLTQTANVNDRVFEFRHESWLQNSTYELLEDQGASFCIAETEDLKPIFKVTGGIAYFRLRRDSYDAKTVDDWAKKVLETSKDSRETYVYLRHDETGENALLAQRLFEKLKQA